MTPPSRKQGIRTLALVCRRQVWSTRAAVAACLDEIPELIGEEPWASSLVSRISSLVTQRQRKTCHMVNSLLLL